MTNVQIPANWHSTVLGAVIDGFEAGRNLLAEGRPANQGEFGVLKISAVSWGEFRPRENKALLARDQPKPHEIVRRGDLLISRANTSELVGAVALVDEDYPFLMLPDKVLRLKVRTDLVDPRFLVQALRLPAVRAEFEANATGTSDSMRNLSQPKMEAAPVLLPPLREQRRIVAKLEALQARSRRAREALDAVPPLLEKLRQSILASAFRGDLTKAWRATHKNTEPATELLKRIRIERRSKWEESELAKMTAKGNAPADDRWKAKYKEPEGVDSSGFPALAGGWCWASIDEVLLSLRNGISTKPDQADGLRILRISAVRPLRVDLDDVRFLPRREEYEGYELTEGDLLLTRYNGNADLVGVAAIVRDLRSPTVYPDKLIRASAVKTVALPEFLALALNTGSTRAHIAERGKSAAGQIGVSGGDIRSAPVPLPPLGEQLAIVQVVGRLLATLAPMARKLKNTEGGLARLEAAMLAKAFRGELVPQDPNDEPAEAMLQRLAPTSETSPTNASSPKRGRARATASTEPPND